MSDKIMSDKDKVEKFIKDNNLDFSGDGSELNSNCVTLSGYMLYIGIEEDEQVDMVLEDLDISLDGASELERVFDYAKNNDYGLWWEKEENRNKFNL